MSRKKAQFPHPADQAAEQILGPLPDLDDALDDDSYDPESGDFDLEPAPRDEEW